MKLQALRGFKDWGPEDFRKYHYLSEVARKVLSLYGYEEIKIPILEKTELFVRSIGEVTDIVQKETYSFKDRSGELLTMRPEATAGICRMIIEGGLYNKQRPLRFFTIGPMFRHERPQKGRLREFYQVDIEYFGEVNPYVEAELIDLALSILRKPAEELDSFQYPLSLEINSIGCKECRPDYRKYLVETLTENGAELCETCQGRLERNPLRILDCKEKRCQEVVRSLRRISEFWCKGCADHFEILQKVLSELHISYVHNPFLVRGLDYYVRTIFEVKASGLSAQDTVCAGGRYDSLVEELGGPSLPGIGFAIGVERWGLALFGEGKGLPCEPPRLTIVTLGDSAKLQGLKLAKKLRAEGISLVLSLAEKSLKAQLRSVDKSGTTYCLIIGEEEVKREEVILRDMKKGTQEVISLKDIKALLQRLKK